LSGQFKCREIIWRGKMKLRFYYGKTEFKTQWDELDDTYEGETWKECCEGCVSQEENWDRELIEIKMESKTGDMEDAPKEVYAYYNILIDASLGLEE